MVRKFRLANILSSLRKVCAHRDWNYAGRSSLLEMHSWRDELRQEFRAFDKSTGSFGGRCMSRSRNATPATYETGGRQYWSSPRWRQARCSSGGTYVAFALQRIGETAADVDPAALTHVLFTVDFI